MCDGILKIRVSTFVSSCWKAKMNGREVFFFVLVTLAVQSALASLTTSPSRTKRTSAGPGKCQELTKRFENCTSKLTWNLRELPSVTNCQNKDYSNASTCAQTALCKRNGCTDLNGFEEKALHCSKDEPIKKVLFLKILCSTVDLKGVPCIRSLVQAYLLNQAHWNETSELLKQLNATSTTCCLGSLISLYNSSGSVPELLPSTWEKSGITVPRKCNESHQTRSKVNATSAPISTQSSTSKTIPNTKPSTKKTTQATKATSTTKLFTTTQVTTKKVPINKPSKMSSKLKASLVIASIIFIVLVVVIVRFIYHRIQRNKRAKYEDYGYSQLKVILDDNLYEDDEDEDDDQLLSAT